MKLSVMALRSIIRNRRRSFITSLSVAFGIFLAVTFTGAGYYSYSRMIDTGAVMGYGHVTATAAGFVDRPSFSRRLESADLVRREALRLDGVQGAYARIMGQGMLAAGAESSGGMLLGIDPAVENPRHNFFLRSIVKGRLFEDSGGRGAVIGVKMAGKLNLEPGRKMILTVTDSKGELTSELLRISGLFRTGDQAVDSGMVLLPLNRLRQVLGYNADGASLVAVYLDDQRQAEKVKQVMARKIDRQGKVEVLTWRETQPDLAGLIAVDRLFNYLLQFLVGLVIAAGIMNTMLMSVLERRKELGIMMAVGMSPSQVVRLVLIESLWLGCLGLVLGVILTAPWFYYMSTTGLDLSRYVGEDYSAAGVLVDPVMKIRLYRQNAAAIIATVLVLTMAAGLYPAVKAGRVPPVKAIKDIR